MELKPWRKMTDAERKAFIEWIANADQETTQAIEDGLRKNPYDEFYDTDEEEDG